MSIDVQLYLIVGGLVVCSLITTWQAFQLRKIYRSSSSLIGALAFLAFGGKQVYGLVRLKSNIAGARLRGVMIDHLSTEQWLVGVVWSYAIVFGFILWMHWQHRDLKKLGV